MTTTPTPRIEHLEELSQQLDRLRERLLEWHRSLRECLEALTKLQEEETLQAKQRRALLQQLDEIEATLARYADRNPKQLDLFKD